MVQHAVLIALLITLAVHKKDPRAYFLSFFAGVTASTKTEKLQGNKAISALIRMQQVLLS